MSIFKPGVTYDQLAQRCIRAIIMTKQPLTLYEVTQIKCATGVQMVTNHQGLTIYKEMMKVNDRNDVDGTVNAVDRRL